MEVLFILLLLVWIVSQLFAQRAPAGENTNDTPAQHTPSQARPEKEKTPSLREALREIEGHLSGTAEPSPQTERHQHWESGTSASPELQQPERYQSSSRDRRPSTPRQSVYRKPSVRDEAGRQGGKKIPSFDGEITGPPTIKESTTAKHNPRRPLQRQRVRARLKSHRTRREIFLLKELIDPPRSKRPWPR